MASESLIDAVRELFTSNRRTVDGHTYTVPSPTLYPFQWLWDSCFHAIILSHFDIDAAKEELRSVTSHPLPSGLLPHIIYWTKDTGAPNWGREMRGDVLNNAWKTDGVSSITQPPVLAYALWRIFERDGDPAFLAELYPTILRHMAYIDEERTFHGDSLVYLINPDESGEDNSPRFDRAQKLRHAHTAGENLDQRLLLIKQNAACKFDARTCMSKHFGVADVPFNVLYAQDLSYLSRIAHELGCKSDAQLLKERADSVRNDMRALLRCGDLFCSYDHVRDETIETLTWSIFMPLYGGLLSQREAEQLVADYLDSSDHFRTRYMVPTVATSEPSYDPKDGIWRGPVWFAPNWFIYRGLRKYGFIDHADTIKKASLALIEQSGFREQYHPDTGAGQGATQFTWGGLVLDMI